MRIDGKAISAQIRAELKEECEAFVAENGFRPGLTVVIVGEDPASQVYVRNKVKAAAYTGMESRLVELPADIAEEELEKVARAGQ